MQFYWSNRRFNFLCLSLVQTAMLTASNNDRSCNRSIRVANCWGTFTRGSNLGKNVPSWKWNPISGIGNQQPTVKGQKQNKTKQKGTTHELITIKSDFGHANEFLFAGLWKPLDVWLRIFHMMLMEQSLGEKKRGKECRNSRIFPQYGEDGWNQSTLAYLQVKGHTADNQSQPCSSRFSTVSVRFSFQQELSCVLCCCRSVFFQTNSFGDSLLSVFFSVV